MEKLRLKVLELCQMNDKIFCEKTFIYFYNKFYFSGCNTFILGINILKNLQYGR